MIRDRGTIKWTAMMLPEHVKLLRELHEDRDKQEKPLLDEGALEEMDRMLGLAIETKLPIQINYFEKGYFKNLTGLAKRYDPLNRKLCIETREGWQQWLLLDQLTNVFWADDTPYQER